MNRIVSGTEILVHGNSSQMHDVRDGEATLVLTGPPYFPDDVESQLIAGMPQAASIDELAEKITAFAWGLRPVFEECSRMTADGGHLVMQTRDVRLRERLVSVEAIHRELAEICGFRLYARHNWVSKYTAMSRRRLWSHLVSSFGPLPNDPEVFLVFSKPGPPSIGQPTAADIELLRSDLMRTSTGRLPSRHRHQSPIPVVNAFIRTYSKAGDLVVDPFAGGGTVLRCATILGRRSVGFEVSRESLELARKNLQIVDVDG